MTPSPNRTNVELPHHDEEPEGIDGGFGACFEDNDYTFQDDASQQNLSIDGEESAQNDPHRGEKMTNFVGDVVTTTQNPELTGHSTQNSLSLLGTPKAIEGLGEAETQSQNLPNGTTMPEESIDLGSFAINHSSIYDTDASTSLDPNFNSALDDWNENDLNPEEGWKNFFNSSPGPTSVADEAFKNIENNGFGSQNNFVQPDSNGRVNQNVQQEQTSGQFADFLPNDDFLDNRNQHTGSTQNGHGFYPGLGSTYSLENETNDARGGEPFQRNGCPQYTSGRQAQSSNAADFGDFGEYSRSIIAPTFNNCGQQIPLNPRQNLYSQSSCRDSEPPIYACPQHFTPHGVDSNKNSTNLMHGGRPQMPRGSRPPPPMIGPQPNPTQTGPVPAPAPSRTLIQPDYRVKDYIWSEPPQGKSPNKAKAEDEKWNAYPRGPREILSSPFPEYFGDPEDPDSFLPQKIPWKMLSPLQLVEWKGSSGHVRDLVEQEIMPRLEDYPGKNENDTPAEKKVKESKICRRISMREQRQRLGRQLMGDAKYQKKGKGKNDLETPEVILKFFKNLTTAQLLHGTWGDIDLRRWVAVARFTGSGGYTGDVEYPLQEPCGLPVEIAEGMRLAGWEPPNLHEYLRQNPRIWQHFWPELFSKDELPGCLPRGAPFQRTRGSHKRGRSDETAHTNLAAGPIGTQPSTFPPQNNQPEFGCEDVRKKPRTGATHYDMDEDAPTCFNGPESYTNRHVQYQPSGRTQRPKVTTQIQRHRQETTNSRAQRMGPYINQQFHNIIQDVDARARQAQVQPNAGSRHVSTQASNPTPMHRGLKHGQSLAENTDWEQHNPLLARSVDKARNELSIPQSYQVPTKLPAGKINMRKKSRRSESPNSDTGIDLVRDYHGLSRPWFVSTTKSAVQASHTPPGMPSSPSGQESREANGDATAETVEDTQSNDIFSENEPLTATEDFGNPNGQPQPQSAPSCPQNEVYDDSGFVEGFLDHSTNNYPSFLNLPENGVSNQPGQFQCWWDGNDFRNVEHNHGQLTGAYALNMQPLTEYGPPRFWEGYNNNLGDGNGQSQLEDVDNAEFGLEQWQQELTQSTQPTQPGSQYGGNDTYPVGFGHTGQEQTEAVTQPNFVENTQLVKGNGVQGGALSQSKLAWPIDPQLHNGYVPHSDQITSTQPLERNEVEDGAPQIESHEQSEEERLQELWHHVYTHPGGVFEDCPSCREHAKLMEAKRMEAFWGSASP